MQKMADDILSLRRHVTSLESENSTLRRSLAMHEDVGRTLLEDMDLDVMTKAEIVDRIRKGMAPLYLRVQAEGGRWEDMGRKK